LTVIWLLRSPTCATVVISLMMLGIFFPCWRAVDPVWYYFWCNSPLRPLSSDCIEPYRLNVQCLFLLSKPLGKIR
jgi:hypothetical protein